MPSPGLLIARARSERGARASRREMVRSAIAGIEPKQLQEARKRWMPRLSHDAVRGSLEIAARTGLHLLAPDGEGWPAKLADLDVHAPHVLWVRGDASAPSRLRPSVALIGARAATSYGEHVAIDLPPSSAHRGSSSSRARPTASTAPRTARRSLRAAPRSRCSRAASTAPTRRGTATSSSGSARRVLSSARCRRARRRRSGASSSGIG